MMGIKERIFGPLPPVSLDDLVPPDHVYRHLERTLDLAFVRELVGPTYADSGRPSIDPVGRLAMTCWLFRNPDETGSRPARGSGRRMAGSPTRCPLHQLRGRPNMY
jgi:hypothetical protein